MSTLFDMGPDNNPLTDAAVSPPSSAEDRIEATVGALTARDNWYFLERSRRMEYDKVISAIRETTGEDLKNPDGLDIGDLRPDQTEFKNAGGQRSVIRANRMAELVRAANAARELNPNIPKPDEIEAYLKAEGDRERMKAAGLVDTGAGVPNFMAEMVVGTVVDPLQMLSLFVPMTRVASGGAAILSREGLMNVGREALLQGSITGATAGASQILDRAARNSGGQYVPGTRYLGQEMPTPEEQGINWAEIATAVAGGATFGAAFRIVQLKLLQRGKKLDQIGTPEQRLSAAADEAVELYGNNPNGLPLAVDEAAKSKVIVDLANGKSPETSGVEGSHVAPTSELAASLTQEERLVTRAQEIGAALSREKDPLKAAELRREAMEINRVLREAEPENVQATTGAVGAAGDAAPTIPTASTAPSPPPSSPRPVHTEKPQARTPSPSRRAVAERIAAMPDEKIETITLEANPKLKEQVDAARARFKEAELENARLARGSDIEPEKPLTKAQRIAEAKAAKEAAAKAADAGEVPKVETRPLTIRDVASEAQKDRLDELTFMMEASVPTSAEYKSAKKELQTLRQELFKEIEKQRPKAEAPLAPKQEDSPQAVPDEPNEIKQAKSRLAKMEATLADRVAIGDKTPATKRALESAESAVDRLRTELLQLQEFWTKKNPAYASEMKLTKAKDDLARAEAHLKREMAATRNSLIEQATLKTEGITPAEAAVKADAAIARKEQSDLNEVVQSKPTASEIPAPIEQPKPRTEGEIKVAEDENWKSLQEQIELGAIDPNLTVADGISLKDMIELADIKEKEALAIVACTAGSAI